MKRGSEASDRCYLNRGLQPRRGERALAGTRRGRSFGARFPHARFVSQLKTACQVSESRASSKTERVCEGAEALNAPAGSVSEPAGVLRFGDNPHGFDFRTRGGCHQARSVQQWYLCSCRREEEQMHEEG